MVVEFKVEVTREFPPDKYTPPIEEVYHPKVPDPVAESVVEVPEHIAKLEKGVVFNGADGGKQDRLYFVRYPEREYEPKA